MENGIFSGQLFINYPFWPHMDIPQRSEFEIEVFFDGDCPLCRREIGFIRRKDKQGRVLFRDIAKLDFSESNPGRTYEQLMSEIHGRLPNGQWITGVEVFRRIYTAIGWRTLSNMLRWPVLRSVLDWTYPIFARNRLRLTGRRHACRFGECDRAASVANINKPTELFTDVNKPL